MTRIAAVFCISLMLLPACILRAQTGETVSKSTPPQVSIAGTQLLSIQSSITNENYSLLVNLPANYGDTTRVYPVVYLLDGQWDFPLVQSIYGEQYYDGFIPGLIVVGITWGGTHPNYDSLRARDFTPSQTGATPYGGNAANFLQFIKKELIPFIKSKYRVNDDRTLVGSSLGGLFTLYTMFNETRLFNRYCLTSPAVSWGENIINKYAKEYASKNKLLSARLYMGIGEYEDASAFNEFVTLLKSINYEGLSLETKILENVGHSGTKAEGYSWGLQYVFAKPSLKLSNELLKQYEGDYSIFPGYKVNISVDKGRLLAKQPDGSKRYLSAETETDFYITGMYMVIHFAKDDSGKVTGCKIENYSGTTYAKVIAQ
jgi:predicted alpha/beta superfamily hydrolase